MDTSMPVDTEAITQEIQEAIASLPETIQSPTFWSSLKEFILGMLPTLITAVVILVLGIILIRLTVSFVRKLMERSKFDPTLHSFTLSILRITLYILLGITVLAVILPKAVSGLIAALGIFGLAISLAVKDSLANLAGGLSVLFTKPFALEDYVMVDKTEGTVREIRLNYTVLTTVDNKTIHIPNGDVAKAEIVNFTYQATRRLDLRFSIGYHNDFEKAKSLISELVDRHELALPDPAPVVRVIEHAESALVLCCRVWVNTPDYWSLYFDLMEQVKLAFDQNGISIPYPKMDVSLVPNVSGT